MDQRSTGTTSAKRTLSKNSYFFSSSTSRWPGLWFVIDHTLDPVLRLGCG